MYLTNCTILTKESVLEIVVLLRTKREQSLIESSNRSKKSTRASSVSGTSKTKTSKPKFASSLLEQLFQGLTPEMQEIVLGKKPKKNNQ